MTNNGYQGVGNWINYQHPSNNLAKIDRAWYEITVDSTNDKKYVQDIVCKSETQGTGAGFADYRDPEAKTRIATLSDDSELIYQACSLSTSDWGTYVIDSGESTTMMNLFKPVDDNHKFWWRSPGYGATHGAVVYGNGIIDYTFSHNQGILTRPALWITIQ